MKIETNEQLQECIEAIEDALERGVIEERLANESKWRPEPMGSTVILGPDADCIYRLKPKPREFELTYYGISNIDGEQWEVYRTLLRPECRPASFRVREVIE